MSVFESGNSKRNDIAGHIKFLIGPQQGGTRRDDTLLRRITPYLVCLFVVLIVVVRGHALWQERNAVYAQARMTVALIADSAHAALAEATRNGFAPANGAQAETILARALPREATFGDRVILVIDADGTVIGGRNAERFLGNAIEPLLEEDQALFMFGRKAGVQTVLVDGRQAEAAFASTGSGQSGVLIMRYHSSIFAPWQRAVSLNVSLFVAMTSVLLTLLYGYFSHSARARDNEIAYRQAHARVEQALSRGFCGLWDWDLARGRIYWSQSMFEMLGYQPIDDVMSVGQVQALIHEDDADLFSLAQSIAEEEIDRVDELFRMRHADGHFVWMRIRTERVEQENGPTHLIGIAVDMTENHRLALESERASSRLKTAIENTSQSFAIFDMNDALVLCNQRFLKVHGLTASQARPGTLRSELDRMMTPPIHERRIFMPNESASESLTIERQIRDGVWLQVTERRTADGGVISVGTDITQLKMQEEKLIDSERQLMATVKDELAARKAAAEKAEELSILNQRFLEEKDRAEAAYRTKSEFLANMSHELRTPLNAVIGFSEVMQSRMFGPLGDDRYEGYVNDIHNSGKFLMSVISDILEMSKIEAGRLVLEREDINLDTIFIESVQMISQQAADKKIDVHHTIAKGLCIRADARAMRQIAINLLSNAVKFTDEGGRIQIRSKIVGDYVQFSIDDTGCGIPASALKRLGQPFEQVQKQLSKNHSGTGLGLAIAKSLAQLHGGSLRIRSKVGVGTMVSVRIPVCCQDEGSQPGAMTHGDSEQADQEAPSILHAEAAE